MLRVCQAALVGAACLVLASCGSDGPGHPAGIGNACAVNADCPTNNCYLGPWGGYCTATCQNEGSTAECPTDTVCKPIQGGARRCLLICGSKYYCPPDTVCEANWCPYGSSCTDISQSDLKGCEPSPS